MKDAIIHKRVSVTVMDKNNITKDAFMSKGDFSLRKAASKCDTVIKQTVRLKDIRGQSAGKLEITLQMKHISSDGVATSDFPQELGKIQLLQCNVTQLTSGTPVLGISALSKQSVYAQFKLVQWSYMTEGIVVLYIYIYIIVHLYTYIYITVHK